MKHIESELEKLPSEKLETAQQRCKLKTRFEVEQKEAYNRQEILVIKRLQKVPDSNCTLKVNKVNLYKKSIKYLRKYNTLYTSYSTVTKIKNALPIFSFSKRKAKPNCRENLQTIEKLKHVAVRIFMDVTVPRIRFFNYLKVDDKHESFPTREGTICFKW